MSYLGNWAEDSTGLTYKFTTRNTTGEASALSSGLIDIYKGSSTSPTTAGVTLTSTFASVTGFNHVGIDLSSTSFYAISEEYTAILSQGEVNGVDVTGEVVFSFSIENRFDEVDVTKVSGSAEDIATETKQDTLTEGLILQNTTIATLASQTSFTLTAGSTDDNAYNAATIVIVDASTSTQKAFGSLSDYTGATKTVTLAQDPGIFTMATTDKVYIIPSDVFAMADRVLTGATHNVPSSWGRRIRGIQEFQGYEGGKIWIDTVNGTAGTVDYENGTVENPVDSLADAITLNSSLGFNRYHIFNGSTITLASTFNNSLFDGENWTLALGGQDAGGSHFIGAVVSGIATGTETTFINCHIGTCTIDLMHFETCSLTGTITIGSAGDQHISNCHSDIAGTSTPIFDSGAAVANSNINFRSYSGGIEIRNLNAAGTDNFSIEGMGQIIYAASSSGTVNQRGMWKVTNTGGVTITADDNTTALDTMGIKKNTAFDDFEFPMVLASDHYTAATGLTVTGQMSIDGAAFANVNGTIAEVGSGVYQIDLTAADTNGDVITYKFSEATADDTLITITTRE